MNILLTSVGRRTYMVKYFKEALGEHGKVFVTNSISYSPAFHVADDYAVSPLIYSGQYIDFLLSYCIEKEIKLIISLFDADLPVLSKNKELFQQHQIRIFVSDENVIRICNDKYESFRVLSDKGFNVPNTYLNLSHAIEEAHNDKENFFPVMIKPRWGMGSIGIFEASNIEEMNFLYHYSKKQVTNTYLKYESESDWEQCVIIQQKVGGQEYGLDVINDIYGEYGNTIVKKKIAMRAGETDIAQVIRNNSLEELGSRLSETLGHVGNLDVDVLRSDKDYIIDLNARFGGGYPFSHLAGANLPQAIVQWMNGVNQVSCLGITREIFAYKDINIIENG